MKKCLRWLVYHWKLCLWAVLVLVSLGVFGLLCYGDGVTVEQLFSQQGAARWATEEKPYSLSTVFLQEGEAIPTSALSEIRLKVENAMTVAGVPSEEYPWIYACSRTEQATLKNGASAVTVEMTLVSGDYFKLHPLPVRNGWYFSQDEVMRDRIVLDRQTAWDLFYSDNVVGQYLTWNGQNYVVAAVVDMEPGDYNEMAAGNVSRAWALADSPAADETKGFTCVEMVLPQPVEGFAVSTMKSALDSYLKEGTEPFHNSERFSLVNRWNALRTISTRWISSQAIAYPYYENAARLVENHLALRLIPEFLFLGFPVISLCIWLWLLNKKRTWGLHSIRDAIDRAVEKKRTRDYEARLQGQNPEKRSRRKRKKQRL